MKFLVGRRNQLAVRPLHRSAHRACKIRNRTRPFALSNLHFIGIYVTMRRAACGRMGIVAANSLELFTVSESSSRSLGWNLSDIQLQG